MRSTLRLDRRASGDRYADSALEVTFIGVSHDAAEPCGFIAEHDGLRVAVFTDLGYVTPVVLEAIQSADIIVLESNYDRQMLGYAVQKGLLPLSVESIHEAIRLNGSFVKGNLRTFALGRLAAHNPAALAAELDDTPELPALDTVDQVLESRTRLLTDYYGRVAFPLVTIVMVVVGIALSLRRSGVRGGSMAVGIGQAFIVGFCYWTTHSVAIALGRGGALAPMLAGWMANAVFLSFGLYLLLKVRH